MDLRPKGPIFGLTLKGMLIITALLAVGMALVGTKVKRARDEEAIARDIVRVGGSVQRQHYGVAMASAGTERTWFERLVDLDVEARITGISLHGPNVTDALIARLAGLEDLQSVVIINTRVDGSGFAALARLPKLTSLALRENPAITDEGLAAICTLPNVEDCIISDVDLAPIGRLRSLKRLELREELITDASLRALKLPLSVEQLSVSHAQISDDGLAVLVVSAPGLRTLSISECPISGRGLAALKGCSRLKTLQVFHCPLTDEGVAGLAQMQQLESLRIVGPLSDGVLRHIGHLTGLTNLEINGADVIDEGLRNFTGLGSLTHLIFKTSGSFTDAGLEHLRGLKNLTWVNLSPNTFSEDGVNRLEKAVPGVYVAR